MSAARCGSGVGMSQLLLLLSSTHLGFHLVVKDGNLRFLSSGPLGQQEEKGSRRAWSFRIQAGSKSHIIFVHTPLWWGSCAQLKLKDSRVRKIERMDVGGNGHFYHMKFLGITEAVIRISGSWRLLSLRLIERQPQRKDLSKNHTARQWQTKPPKSNPRVQNWGRICEEAGVRDWF